MRRCKLTRSRRAARPQQPSMVPGPDCPARRRTAGRRRRSAARRLGAAAALAITLGGALGTGASLAHDLPTLDLSAFTDLSAASLVYDGAGNLIGRFASEGDRRPLRRLADSGENLRHALLAAEDKDFYHHFGVDPVAIARSAWNNLRRRAITSGASTITQQTVKLAMFPRQERTWRRKIQEMVLAVLLERRQSKNQILLEYMNAIYFGHMHGVPVYGVQSAALHAFGVPARRLTVAQAALLAALPNNPAGLSPWRHPQRALARQRWILARMRDIGVLDVTSYRQARSERVLRELATDPVLYAPYESRTPYIVEAVSRVAPALIAHAQGILEAAARAGLQTGGYRIHTSIDPGLEATVTRLLEDPHSFPVPQSYVYVSRTGPHLVLHADEEAGMVAIDNRTRRIIALGGGRNFSHDQVDHTVMRRQPGSALKPLIVYAPAIERGLLTPGSIVDDEPRHYYDPYAPDHDWFPKNWDGRFHGLMTVRDALMQSYNGPAIEVLQELGPRTAAEYGWSLGLSGINGEDAQSLGLAIGGIRGGVSPLELAQAYATLPAGGLYAPATLIDSIENADGQVIYTARHDLRRVFSPTTAHLTTRMLQSVITSPYGTAHMLAALEQKVDIAGKTGTTDDNHDAWFVGYTPRLTVSTWVGYDIPHPLPASTHESLRPVRLFRALCLTRAMANGERFAASPTVHRVKICTKSGELAGPLCDAAGDAEWDAFADGTEPRSMCQLHRIALTTVSGGKRVLATELTPRTEIRREIVLDRRPTPLEARDIPFSPDDEQRYMPDSTDPRGGTPLSDEGTMPPSTVN